jgi:hypothetical protein
MPATLEILADAFDALTRARIAGPVAEVRAESRLFDVCILAGMDRHEPDHLAWAGERVAAWLCAA